MLMLDLAILGLLHEQELHGYEIRRRLRDELGLFANISFGSLYPALSRLESAGAVTVTESTGSAATVPPIPPTGSLGGERAGLRARRAGAPRTTKRSRKVYRITDEGRALFERLLDAEEPAGTDDARSFGLRLAFARHLAPSARLALLEHRRVQLTRRLASDRVPRRREHASTSTPARWSSTAPRQPSTTSPGWTSSSSSNGQKQAAPRSENREPLRGDAVTATKGTDS